MIKFIPHKSMPEIRRWLIIMYLVGAWLGAALTVQAERGLNVGEVHIVNTQSKEIILYKRSHALIIGISNYTQWPTLPGVEKDVQEVKAVLEAQGFNVTVKRDVDKNALEQAFDEFISQYGHAPDNRLVFYFAGHGQTVKTSYGGELGYIIPIDAPNPNYDLPNFQRMAMEMQQIEIYAKRIQSKHALFLFDACFSGALFALDRAIPDIISYKTANPVWQFITSGSADETVPDESIFRAQFVQALRGEADNDQDGYVTGTELGEFLQRTVVNYSHNTQHPQYGKIRDPNLDKGDFVFKVSISPEREAKAPSQPVSETTFSLRDLQEAARKEEQAAWQTKLTDMENAFSEVREYETRDISAALKITAWERFVQTFLDDNPYSTHDDELRRTAEERIIYWQDDHFESGSMPQELLGEGRVVITGSDDKHRSLEFEEYQLGLFTYHLTEGLRGKADSNDDGIIEVEEIWDYIKYQVVNTSRKADNLQAPLFQGSMTAGIPLTFSQIQYPGEVYAVIIGIGDYMDNRIPDLRFTVNDAQEVYDVLTNPTYGRILKDHVRILLNREATTQTITEAFTWLSLQAKEEDIVILFYSGHGAPEKRESYWVTYNTKIDDLSTTALSNNSLTDMISRIRAKRIVTFLDVMYFLRDR